jgi:hypothetical protein
MIYIKTQGRPKQGRSSICLGSIGILGTYPLIIAFSLILYKEAFKTLESLITLKTRSL